MLDKIKVFDKKVEGEVMYEYILKLKRYLNVDLNYEIHEDSIEIRIDNEIRYLCNFKEKKFYFYERNKCSEIECSRNCKLLKLEFALAIISNFSEAPDYGKCNIFGKANNLNELEKIACDCFEKKYYSIKEIEETKICLIFDQCYKIVFRCNNEDYVIAVGNNKIEIFEGFYCEIVAFHNLINDIELYEKIFNETFTKEEVFKVSRYGKRTTTVYNGM